MRSPENFSPDESELSVKKEAQKESSTSSVLPSFESLTEADEVLLLEAGKNTLEQLLSDFPDKLPDAVILPDSSARPLLYLAKPTLDAVAKLRGVDSPKYYFMATTSSKDIRTVLKLEKYNPRMLDRVFESQSGVISQQQQQDIERLNTNRKRYRHGLPPLILPAATEAETSNQPAPESNQTAGFRQKLRSLFTSRQKIDHQEHKTPYQSDSGEELDLASAALNTSRALTRHKWRADEIVADLRRQGKDSPQVAVLDDYASDYFATAKLISRAFGQEVPTYALLSTSDQQNKQHESAQNVRIGLQVDEKRVNSFDYRPSKFAIGVRKNKQEIEKPYAENYRSIVHPDNQPRVSEEMRLLRHEMSRVGQQIAQELLAQQSVESSA